MPIILLLRAKKFKREGGIVFSWRERGIVILGVE